jgi:hypothetical protein
MRAGPREGMIRIMAAAGLAAIMLFSWLGQADAGTAVRAMNDFVRSTFAQTRWRHRGAAANLNFESEEHTCQWFVSRDLVFRWTVSAQG